MISRFININYMDFNTNKYFKLLFAVNDSVYINYNSIVCYKRVYFFFNDNIINISDDNKISIDKGGLNNIKYIDMNPEQFYFFIILNDEIGYISNFTSTKFYHINLNSLNKYYNINGCVIAINKYHSILWFKQVRIILSNIFHYPIIDNIFTHINYNLIVILYYTPLNHQTRSFLMDILVDLQSYIFH